MDANQIIPTEITNAQIAAAREWERLMNKAFKGIYPKNERRKALARGLNR
jgi:ribosomal protein L13